ncbi:MAG TPA: Gfo/Idh/MocA family oxidoreductase [Verrucomicrobiae bacterium]|jgi:UDP-N-acetyl-2-amino-2-deoxyglucuronate dehydrogenase|nr:Gfo/Idh/MocA family oxidoreductase [Verrucomicrobiae bacterium]
MKIGLIGGGNISITHARAASAIPGLEIAAVYGTNQHKVQQLCREYRAAPYDDLAAFLAHRPMEMVIIGSPSGLHAQQGILAAQQGLHVLVEKPIDVCSEKSAALIAACEAAKVKLAVIFQDRFKPQTRRLKQLIQDGVLGRVLLADARVKWYRPPEYYCRSRWRGSWALDGGALMNQGVHTVDLLLWLLGDVARVQARTATLLHSIEAEDTALALLEFENGSLGTLQATTAAYPGYLRRLEITGTEGTVILENDLIIAADLRRQETSLTHSPTADQNQSASSPVVDDVRGHQSAIDDFVRAVEQNKRPACDGHEAQRSLALIERIYQASAQFRGCGRV